VTTPGPHIVTRGPYRSHLTGAWYAGPCTCGVEAKAAASAEEAEAVLADCRAAQARRAGRDPAQAARAITGAGDPTSQPGGTP
jgi:hypothetical protein